MFAEFVPSLIRTYVPIGVAAVVAWLAQAGVILDSSASDALANGLGALAGAIYYAAIRYAEQRWPRVGILLGSSKQPIGYAEAVTPDPVDEH